MSYCITVCVMGLEPATEINWIELYPYGNSGRQRVKLSYRIVTVGETVHKSRPISSLSYWIKIELLSQLCRPTFNLLFCCVLEIQVTTNVKSVEYIQKVEELIQAILCLRYTVHLLITVSYMLIYLYLILFHKTFVTVTHASGFPYCWWRNAVY